MNYWTYGTGVFTTFPQIKKSLVIQLLQVSLNDSGASTGNNKII